MHPRIERRLTVTVRLCGERKKDGWALNSVCRENMPVTRMITSAHSQLQCAAIPEGKKACISHSIKDLAHNCFPFDWWVQCVHLAFTRQVFRCNAVDSGLSVTSLFQQTVATCRHTIDQMSSLRNRKMYGHVQTCRQCTDIIALPRFDRCEGGHVTDCLWLVMSEDGKCIV